MIGKSTNEEHCDLMADFINGIGHQRPNSDVRDRSALAPITAMMLSAAKRLPGSRHGQKKARPFRRTFHNRKAWRALDPQNIMNPSKIF